MRQNTGEIKGRDKGGVDRAALLHEGLRNTEPRGVRTEAAVVLLAHRVGKLRVFRRDPRHWGVLIHKTDIDIVAEGGKIFDDIVRIAIRPGKHHIPHDNAAPHDPLAVKDGGAALRDHLFKSGARHLGIVGGSGIPLGQQGVGVLEIGKVDINKAAKKPQPLCFSWGMWARKRGIFLQNREKKSSMQSIAKWRTTDIPA